MVVSIHAMPFDGLGDLRIPPGARNRIMELCGTSEVKLVFQIGVTLGYVDFSVESPQITTIPGVTGQGVFSYLPVISPDGKWIMFVQGARDDGSNVDSSSVWVTSLQAGESPKKILSKGYVPRFVHGRLGDTLEIVYGTSSDCPGTPKRCDLDGTTIRQAIVPLTGHVGPEVSLYGNGSYYGGLSQDERYLCTGWMGSQIDVLMKDLRNRSLLPKHMHTMTVKKKASQTDTLVTVPSCNPSISPSRVYTDAMLFFDFGSLTIKQAGCHHPVLGTWNVHEILFIARYGSAAHGSTVRAYRTPEDVHVYNPLSSLIEGNGEPIEKEWQNPEWSNHPYYGVAGVKVKRIYATGDSWKTVPRTEMVHLIDFRDGSTVRLIESSDTSILSTVNIYNPYVWVAVDSTFEEDSTWLDGVRLQSASPVEHPSAALRNESERIWLDEGVVRSSARIESVSVYSVLGQLIYRIRPQDPKRVRLSVYGPFRSGVYFVHVKTLSGSKVVLKWIVEDGEKFQPR